MNVLQNPPSLPSLPGYLQEMVLRPPSAGTGLHAWIFKVSLKLHAHLSPLEIYRLLRHVTTNCDRFVPDREITAAISNSARISKPEVDLNGLTAFRNPNSIFSPGSAWPACDKTLQREATRGHVPFEDFVRSSPGAKLRDAEYYIDALMGDRLLCCGASTAKFQTKPRGEWRGSLTDQQFIVPSPMRSVWGLTRDGTKQSMHTLSNTGERRFIVVEFDDADPYLQFSLHQHLSLKAPLALVTYSGGKSFHGWYFCEGIQEEKVRSFFTHAVRLGADSRTWSRSQFVRMPGGYRRKSDGTTVHQGVLYFNPNAFTNSTLSK
jgi:hypothetical protein